jgi:hypothetical protein
MINSVAFPKVAFNNPPSVGPVRAEIPSVDSPINFASGMIASEAKIKIAMGEECIYSAHRLNGTKTRRTLKAFSSIFVFSILTNLLCHLAKCYPEATSNTSLFHRIVNNKAERCVLSLKPNIEERDPKELPINLKNYRIIHYFSPSYFYFFRRTS